MLTTGYLQKKTTGEYGLLVFQHKKNLETVKSLLTLNTDFNFYHFKFCIYTGTEGKRKHRVNILGDLILFIRMNIFFNINI
jgi:hypothetical protein